MSYEVLKFQRNVVSSATTHPNTDHVRRCLTTPIECYYLLVITYYKKEGTALKPDFILSLRIFLSSNDNSFESTIYNIIYFELRLLFARHPRHSLFIRVYYFNQRYC
jgi:hypothetical protein